MRTTECGSTPPASKITESTGSPELSDDGLSLEGYGRFGAHEMPSLLAEVNEIMVAAGCSPVHLVAVGGAPMLTRVPGRQTGVWVPIIRSWALTRGFALHPGTRNRYKIRCTRTQHRPASRQVNDHGRVSGTHVCPEGK